MPAPPHVKMGRGMARSGAMTTGCGNTAWSSQVNNYADLPPFVGLLNILGDALMNYKRRLLANLFLAQERSSFITNQSHPPSTIPPNQISLCPISFRWAGSRSHSSQSRVSNSGEAGEARPAASSQQPAASSARHGNFEKPPPRTPRKPRKPVPTPKEGAKEHQQEHQQNFSNPPLSFSMLHKTQLPQHL